VTSSGATALFIYREKAKRAIDHFGLEKLQGYDSITGKSKALHDGYARK
jgi:hypothetical protein